MTAVVLMIGGGDVGLKIADGLLRQGAVGRFVIGDVNATPLKPVIAMLDCCHDALVAFEKVDGLDTKALESLIRKVQPDLIVQTASLLSPWSIIGRDHPTAKALNSAGIGVQLPAQLPILLNLMRVVRDLDLDIPVANMSMPDITHPILATKGLAPTIGLGNASIIQLRVAAAMKLRQQESDTRDVPLIRLIGHHHHVYGVMQAISPDEPENHVRVYLGENGERVDSLAYEGASFPPGPSYNVVTAASALPILSALLPDANSRRFSAPGPLGLPGGYPIKIDRGSVTLDLPDDVKLDEAVDFNCRIGTLDGVAEIGSDGAVQFTDAAEVAVRDVDRRLTEPLDPWKMADRTNRILKIVKGMGPI